VKSVGALLLFTSCCVAADNTYLGRDVCAGCHKSIAATQAQTAMARTWSGAVPKLIPQNYSATRDEEPAPDIQYLLRRNERGLQFEVQMPGGTPFDFPVEATTGGSRHGLSLFIRLHDLQGLPLPRAPLIETRYLYSSPDHNLALSPGFPSEKPANYETAFGRVLTPGFEQKCLTCHGQPRMEGGHSAAGVTCESCHGPGSSHLVALSRKEIEDKGILNPARLPVAEQMRPCSQCHSGFSPVLDPMPDDLLISDQVRALTNSECWRQSAGQIGCVGCHNPHQDAPRETLTARSEKTCLDCHSSTATPHAALCPVSRVTGCIGCHMPETTQQKPFIITDHWIRVHPEGNVSAPSTQPKWRSQVSPKHLYLKLIVLDDPGKAEALHAQLAAGASFFELARANSLDRSSAVNGGFLGDLETAKLNPAWAGAALQLQPGDISGVISNSGKYYLLQRMPRNFREQAEARFNQAMELRGKGDRQQSAAELLEALKIDPYLLRALTYLGVTYAEAGNPQIGAGIIGVAIRLYPNDAGAHFNLGLAYGAMGSGEETAEYKKALELDPDYVPAYLNLGGAFFSKGQYGEAIDVYRHGIEVNPLVASLHYSLSLALEKIGKSDDAKFEMALAMTINPKVAAP
jgi:predicted CXXCH cytochrome family protein